MFIDRPEWQSRAACKGSDNAKFFPPRGDTSLHAEAKAICKVCPVREQCFDYAVNTVEKHGIWGGATEREWRKERTKQSA